jgi:tetratricopeptide (TPR) repeat protein
VDYRASETPPWLLVAGSMRYFLQNAGLWLWPWGSFGVLLGDAPAEHAVLNALCWLALLALAALLWTLRHRDRALVFGLCWFGLFLLPVCNLLPFGNTPVAVHYLFLPAIGLAIALARSVALALERAGAHGLRAPPGVAAACALVVCAAYAPETLRVVRAWGSDLEIYALTQANYPDNVEALVNLASVHLRRGEDGRAAAALARASRLSPADPGVLRNQYALLWQSGRVEAALALTETPSVRDRAEFLIRRGEALERLERHAEAIAAFELAFGRAQDREERAVAGFRLLIVLVRVEHWARARQLMDRLLAEFPDRPELLQARWLLHGRGPRPD